MLYYYGIIIWEILVNFFKYILNFTYNLIAFIIFKDILLPKKGISLSQRFSK